MKSFIPTTGHCLLITLLLGFSAHSIAFGTLLTSPLERTKLDRQRKDKEVLPVPAQNIKSPSVLKSVSFEGVVTRQSGPGSVWLNGELLDKPPASNTLSTRHGERGVEVKLQSSQHPVWLKPGQLLDVDSGEFSDAYLSDRSNSRFKQSVGEDPEQLEDSPHPLSDAH